MKTRGVGFLLAVVSFLSSAQTSQTGTAHAAGRSSSTQMQVAHDLEQRLTKFREVQMPFDRSGLSAREQKMVDKLADACHYLDDIFWRQVDPEGLILYRSLEGKTSKQDAELRRYLWING